MLKTIAIKLANPEPLMVTWDIGRRCNYDCSYCESTRHNNYSRHRSVDELKKTFEFIKSWTDIVNEYRQMDKVNINFTGGEPTNNPHFMEFIEYVKQFPRFNLSLTTNGAWSPKLTDDIVKHFFGVTVSYHCEADDRLKEQVYENIIRLHESGIWLQVNVMLHTDYFNECRVLCDVLKSKGIKYNPRPIGDGSNPRTIWFKDNEGNMRRTAQEYTTEQQEWFYKHMGVDKVPDKTTGGTDMGRSCCGGRCVLGKVEDTFTEVKHIDTHFKDWYCSVDKYFLHIDNETELVYHHQTCQALYDKKRGAIGSLNESEKLLQELKSNLMNNKIIVCPNDRCGCGMCVPKAKTLEDFKQAVSYKL